MSVNFRDPVDSPVTNAAYMSRTVNTSASGEITLSNAGSGANINNLQAAINKIFSSSGVGGENNASSNTYTEENYIANGDSYKTGIDKLDQSLKDEEEARIADVSAVNTRIDEGAIGFKRYVNDSSYEADNLNGGSLQGGEAYFNTTINRIRFYNPVAMIWESIDAALIAIQETPTEITENEVYEVGQFPISEDALQIYIDGVLLENTDWSFDYNTGYITLSPLKSSGQEIYVYYLTQGVPVQPILTKVQRTEYIVVNATAVTNKYVTLNFIPDGAVELVDVTRSAIGSLVPGTDYINEPIYQTPGDDTTPIVEWRINWDGLAFETDAVDGMILRVFYFEVQS